jgi:hypothetical protein
MVHMKKQRGRRSEASLALVLHAQDDLTTHPRPDAPYGLSDDEAEVWRGVVNNLPTHWFAIETFPLLEAYCRHVVRSRRLAQLINAAESGTGEFDLETYGGLLRLQQAESRAIAMLATKMRIAQQSTITKEDKTKGVGKGKRPWQA